MQQTKRETKREEPRMREETEAIYLKRTYSVHFHQKNYLFAPTCSWASSFVTWHSSRIKGERVRWFNLKSHEDQMSPITRPYGLCPANCLSQADQIVPCNWDPVLSVDILFSSSYTATQLDSTRLNSTRYHVSPVEKEREREMKVLPGPNVAANSEHFNLVYSVTGIYYGKRSQE